MARACAVRFLLLDVELRSKRVARLTRQYGLCGEIVEDSCVRPDSNDGWSVAPGRLVGASRLTGSTAAAQAKSSTLGRRRGGSISRYRSICYPVHGRLVDDWPQAN